MRQGQASIDKFCEHCRKREEDKALCKRSLHGTTTMRMAARSVALLVVAVTVFLPCSLRLAEGFCVENTSTNTAVWLLIRAALPCSMKAADRGCALTVARSLYY